jgi:hypothetical protein
VKETELSLRIVRSLENTYFIPLENVSNALSMENLIINDVDILKKFDILILINRLDLVEFTLEFYLKSEIK